MWRYQRCGEGWREVAREGGRDGRKERGNGGHEGGGYIHVGGEGGRKGQRIGINVCMVCMYMYIIQ